MLRIVLRVFLRCKHGFNIIEYKLFVRIFFDFLLGNVTLVLGLVNVPIVTHCTYFTTNVLGNRSSNFTFWTLFNECTYGFLGLTYYSTMSGYAMLIPECAIAVLAWDIL